MFDWVYTAEVIEILETLDLVGFDWERIEKVAQKMMPARVVLIVEDTENLDDALTTTTAQVAVRVFLTTCSEIQGVCHVAAIRRSYWRSCRSCDMGLEKRQRSYLHLPGCHEVGTEVFRDNPLVEELVIQLLWGWSRVAARFPKNAMNRSVGSLDVKLCG